jgi:hypothetical protein
VRAAQFGYLYLMRERATTKLLHIQSEGPQLKKKHHKYSINQRQKPNLRWVPAYSCIQPSQKIKTLGSTQIVRSQNSDYIKSNTVLKDNLMAINNNIRRLLLNIPGNQNKLSECSKLHSLPWPQTK